MDRARDAVARFVSGRALIPIAVLLVALRFAAPTAIAGLGVTGIDTRPVDSAFSAYAGVLPAILVVLVVFVVWAWPGSFPRSRAAWLTAFLVSVTAILWLGQADARLRLYASPWSGLALGAFAAKTLLRSDESISRLRGNIYDFRGAKLIPTFHPSFLLRSPDRKRDAWEDLKRARALLTSPVTGGR